jgi:hypothetical protein
MFHGYYFSGFALSLSGDTAWLRKGDQAFAQAPSRFVGNKILQTDMPSIFDLSGIG